MRLGVVVPQVRAWRQLADDFRLMEQLGYDVVYVYDHLTHPTAEGRWLADGFSTLAAAATVTTRIELGTLVASATMHSPVSLARRSATVQDISAGRMVLGLGAGSPREGLADRGETLSAAQMSARLRAVVTGLHEVWAGQSEWTSDDWSFSGLQTLPLPEGARPPHLLLAAHGPRAMRLTARFADGWNTYGGAEAMNLEPDDYWSLIESQAARLDQACASVGRDPAELRRSLLLGYGKVRPTDSAAAYRQAIQRARDLGFDEFVVYGPFGQPGDRFFSEVAVHEQVLADVR